MLSLQVRGSFPYMLLNACTLIPHPLSTFLARSPFIKCCKEARTLLTASGLLQLSDLSSLLAHGLPRAGLGLGAAVAGQDHTEVKLMALQGPGSAAGGGPERLGCAAWR